MRRRIDGELHTVDLMPMNGIGLDGAVIGFTWHADGVWSWQHTRADGAGSYFATRADAALECARQHLVISAYA